MFLKRRRTEEVEWIAWSGKEVYVFIVASDSDGGYGIAPFRLEPLRNGGMPTWRKRMRDAFGSIKTGLRRFSFAVIALALEYMPSIAAVNGCPLGDGRDGRDRLG